MAQGLHWEAPGKRTAPQVDPRTKKHHRVIGRTTALQYAGKREKYGIKTGPKPLLGR